MMLTLVKTHVNVRMLLMQGRVEAIAYRDGERRILPVSVELVADHGIVGDAHAGAGRRQVVLFSAAARAAMASSDDQGLCYVRFRENLTVSGIELGALRKGAELTCGDARLRISGAAKRCYPECTLPRLACLIRPHVAFARVVDGGEISLGDTVHLA